MAAVIRRFQGRRSRLREAEWERIAAPLAELRAAGCSAAVEQLIAELLAHGARELASSTSRGFLMLYPAQNDLVVEYLAAHCRYPVLGLRLWSKCLSHVFAPTGEVTLTRRQFAELLGVNDRRISVVTSELERLGALIVERRGRGVRYFLNPLVGTHLPRAERDEAQRRAPKLTVLQGGSDAS